MRGQLLLTPVRGIVVRTHSTHLVQALHQHYQMVMRVLVCTSVTNIQVEEEIIQLQQSLVKCSVCSIRDHHLSVVICVPNITSKYVT